MKGNFDEIIKSDKAVLVDFSAEWCGPCKSLAPILKQLANEMGDRLRIIKIDIDQNQALQQRFQVSSVPTLMLFKNSKLLWRQSGVVPLAELRKVVNKH